MTVERVERWKVRRNPKSKLTPVWDTYEPDGTWSGIHESWDEAMEWATSLSARVEYWLEHQR